MEQACFQPNVACDFAYHVPCCRIVWLTTHTVTLLLQVWAATRLVVCNGAGGAVGFAAIASCWQFALCPALCFLS